MHLERAAQALLVWTHRDMIHPAFWLSWASNMFVLNMSRPLAAVCGLPEWLAAPRVVCKTVIAGTHFFSIAQEFGTQLL